MHTQGPAAPRMGRTSGWSAFGLILLALMIEGFDLQAANFAAPLIVRDFGLAPQEIGPILSASLVGVLFGAILIGPLGDRFGRKRTIIACCLGYGVISLLAAAAQNAWQLIGLRFLIGVGLGAVLPNALALAGELAPRGREAMATGLVGIGITFGGVLAGVSAARLMPVYGWPVLFGLGGVLPLAVAALLAAFLPETPVVLKRVGAKSGLRTILAAGNLLPTLMIWFIFAAILLNVYLLSGWIPLLMTDAGFGTANAAWIATGYQAGGVLGGVVASLALARTAWPVAAIFAGLSAVILALLSIAKWPVVVLVLLLIVAGFLVTGTQNAINGSGGVAYASSVRAAGLGWALGIGRLGSIMGPLVGSLAAALGAHEPRQFFALPVLPLLLAALAALWLARRLTSPIGEENAHD